MTSSTPDPGQGPALVRILRAPDGRLRSGWRLGIHLLLLAAFYVLSIPLALLASTLGQFGAEELESQLMLLVIISAMVVTAATWIARRYLDRSSFVSLGFARDRHVIPDLLFGFALTAVLMGLIFALFWGLGWLRFEGFAWGIDPWGAVLGQTLGWLIAYIFVGYYEELFSRGYQLQNLAEGLNLPLAVLLSSSVFGLLHLGNPSASVLSTLGIFAAGVFLAYAWIRTGQLWLSISLHIGWNFFEGTVFGFAVSGLEGFSLIRHSISGPTLVTGGAFGPEAGLVLLPIVALGIVAIRIYSKGRSRGSGQTE